MKMKKNVYDEVCFFIVFEVVLQEFGESRVFVWYVFFLFMCEGVNYIFKG